MKKTANEVVAPLTTEQQRNMILGVLFDVATEVDLFESYLRHVGFDVCALTNLKDLPDAWLGHYRLGQGTYDVELAANDLLTWPPISSRIFELQRLKSKSSPHDL